MKTLEQLEGAMDGACMTILGDSIEYKTGAGPYVSVKAYVDHNFVIRSPEIGLVLEQDMQVELLVSDHPARPATTDRIKLPKVPGKVFRPINVRLSTSGTHWLLELAETNG